MTTACAGRRVIITGGGGGLGQVVAEALLGRGAWVLLVDLDPGALERAARRLAPVAGERCTVLTADVAEASGRAAIVASAEEMGADVLVNNAGIERASEYTALSEAEVRHAMEVNLLGAMLLSHALLPGMLRQRRGHIITMASMAGIKPVPYNAVYNTAKAGLVAFSTSLTKELAGTGVHATVVCPSAVRAVGMWARASGRLPRNRLVEGAAIAADDVSAAVVRALERRPARVLVAAPAVRAGALLSAVSPAVDRFTDRISGIAGVYRRRIDTDRDNPL